MSDYNHDEIRSVNPGEGWKLRVALVSPAPYSIGLANLGMQLVYKSFNSIPGVACHRVYASRSAMDTRISLPEPKPKTLETSESLSRYHVIAFSFNYENDLLNLPRILAAAGIPLLSKQRDGSFPLILAGGVIATINPEPFSPIVDACVLGECEEIIPGIVTALAESWTTDRDKHEALETLSSIPGMYVPAFYQPEYDDKNRFLQMRQHGPAQSATLYRRYIPQLDAIPGETVIHAPNTEFSDLHLVEISRGCKRNCKFCLISQCYGPFRHRSTSSVMDIVRNAPPGYRIGLLGAGSSEHPSLTDICCTLAAENIRFSLSSIHVMGINRTFVDCVHACGPETLTLAPEVGSHQRRLTLGKNIPNDRYTDAVRMIAVHPVKRIKLYFMIGLPEESRSDLDELTDFCILVQDTIKHANIHSSTIPRLSVAISCYVPKALSAFERTPINTAKRLKEKAAWLTAKLRHIRELAFTISSPRHAIIQGILAKGDRRLCEHLIRASEPGTDWYRTFSDLPDTISCSIFKPLELPVLPWDHLKTPLFCNELQSKQIESAEQ